VSPCISFPKSHIVLLTDFRHQIKSVSRTHQRTYTHQI